MFFQLSESSWILVTELCLVCLSEQHSSGADKRGVEMPTEAKKGTDSTSMDSCGKREEELLTPRS